MNFNQWLELYTERMDDTPGLTQFGLESWNACKNEVLKILNQHKNSSQVYGLHEHDEFVWLKNVFEEIEKL